MFWLLIRTNWVRLGCVSVLAVVFSIASVVFPLLLKMEVYAIMVLVWICVHLVGRLQYLIFKPIYLQVQARWIQATVATPEVCFQSAISMRMAARRKMYELESKLQYMELKLFELCPTLVGLVARLVLLIYCHTVVGVAALLLILLSVLIIGYVGKAAKRLAHQERAIVHDLYTHQVEELYHRSIFGHLGQAQYQELYKDVLQKMRNKELAKSFVAIWIIIVLLVGLCVCYRYFQGLDFCLVLMAWLGLSDQVWSLWSCLVEASLPQANQLEKKQQPRDQNIECVHISDLQVFPHHQLFSKKLLPGHILRISGVNGAGKTTALRCILNQEKPFMGKIQILPLADNNVPGKSICVLSGHVVPTQGVLEDFMTHELAEIFGLSSDIERLEKGLKTSMQSLSKVWSTGMLQKVSLAWVIQQGARLYILDEVCSNIPAEEESIFYDMLIENNPEAIVIFTSHKSLCLNKKRRALFSECLLHRKNR